MRSTIPLFFLLCLSGCVTADPSDALDFGCSDVVVVGRIETLTEMPVQEAETAGEDNNLLANWRSSYQLQIHIKRLVRGSERRRMVPATAIAHAQIRDDRDFLIILTPDGSDGYSLASAALLQSRPILSKSCSADLS